MSDGIVYLIHFDHPINPTRPAQHYVGWTNDLEARIKEHKNGTGAKICAAANRQNIAYSVVHQWEGDRALERQIKRRKNSSQYCPICKTNYRAKCRKWRTKKDKETS